MRLSGKEQYNEAKQEVPRKSAQGANLTKLERHEKYCPGFGLVPKKYRGVITAYCNKCNAIIEKH